MANLRGIFMSIISQHNIGIIWQYNMRHAWRIA